MTRRNMPETRLWNAIPTPAVKGRPKPGHGSRTTQSAKSASQCRVAVSAYLPGTTAANRLPMVDSRHRDEEE